MKIKLTLSFFVICQLLGCGVISSRPVDSRDLWIAVGIAVVVGVVLNDNDHKPAADVVRNGCYTIVPPGIIQRRLC